MKDQEELEWFLSYGTSLFERSPTGAIIDRIMMRAYVSYPCLYHYCQHGILEGVPEGMSHHDGDWCPRCHGTGVIPARLTATTSTEVTARPTHAANRDGAADAIEDDRLAVYAMVSRRLAALAATQQLALRLAYGDIGASYARSPRGRSWAVACLTGPGNRILTRHRLPPGVSPVDELTHIDELDHLSPSGKRDPLLAQAREMAEYLLRGAESAWEKSQ